MGDSNDSAEAEYWKSVLGTDGGRIVWRSAPLKAGGAPYWHAAARVRKSGGAVVDAALALKGPVGDARRLAAIEERLISGQLSEADEVMDAVRDLVECIDDDEGSAAAKSYLAGWVCADVIGRCLN